MMKRFFVTLAVLSVPVLAFAQPGFLSLGSSGQFTVADPDADFLARRTGASVVRWFGFEDNELSTNGGPIYWSNATQAVGTFVNGTSTGFDLTGRVELSTDQLASGEKSLKFFIPSETGAGYSGSFYANFSDDLLTQFTEGDTFYVQWRQRFSYDFLDFNFLENDASSGPGWKQVIIGEGDRPPGNTTGSCTPLELVPQHTDLRGYPHMYHSCGFKDGKYEGLQTPIGAFDYDMQPLRGCQYLLSPPWEWPPADSDCFPYYADEWMTFEVRVTIGTWYTNDANYQYDSTVQLWAARECAAPELIIDRSPASGTGYDLYNVDPAKKYGQVWLTPYHTNKDATQVHPDAYTWYDELIISTAEIPFPCQDGAALPTTQ